MSDLLDRTGEKLTFGSDFLPVIPDFRGHMTADQVISNTTTTLAFAGETLDTHGQHDTVVNNSRWTCVVAGAYRVRAQSLVVVAGAVSISLILRKNGTTILAECPSQASVRATLVVEEVVYLAVGDYLEIQGVSAAAVNATFSLGQTLSFFEVTYIGQIWNPVRRASVLQRLTPAQFLALSAGALVDGDIVELLVTRPDGVVVKQYFRFDATWVYDAFKWHWQGGTEILVVADASVSSTSVDTWQTLTGAPAWTLPFAGVIRSSGGAQVASSVAAAKTVGTIGISNGDTTPPVPSSDTLQGPTTNVHDGSRVILPDVEQTVAVGDVLKMRNYSGISNSAVWTNRRVIFKPVRIQGP